MTTNSSEKHAATSRIDEFALLVDAVQDYALFLLDAGGHIRS